MTAKNDIARLSFEEALKRLESIVRKLESGEAGLEESISFYEEGNALKELCEKKLADAQLRVKKITLDADGKPKSEKFDTE
jgi:exodeoxyribonuclease VII small subunit